MVRIPLSTEIKIQTVASLSNNILVIFEKFSQPQDGPRLWSKNEGFSKQNQAK